MELASHNKALHASVKCLDYIVAKMVIKNGSSLDGMPKATLDKFPFNASHLRPSSMVVQAFEGSRRDVRGGDRSPNSNRTPRVPNYLPSNGHKSCLQLLIRPTLDSFGWGGPFNTTPEVEICGGGTIDYSFGRRHTRELSFFYALCGGCRGVLGNVLSSIGSCEQCLRGVFPSIVVLIWCRIDGSSGDVGSRI